MTKYTKWTSRGVFLRTFMYTNAGLWKVNCLITLIWPHMEQTVCQTNQLLPHNEIATIYRETNKTYINILWAERCSFWMSTIVLCIVTTDFTGLKYPYSASWISWLRFKAYFLAFQRNVGKVLPHPFQVNIDLSSQCYMGLDKECLQMNHMLNKSMEVNTRNS